MTDRTDYHVKVEFVGSGLTANERNRLLMAWEKIAWDMTGKPVQVFLDRMGDDSKLRVAMTPEERAQL